MDKHRKEKNELYIVMRLMKEGFFKCLNFELIFEEGNKMSLHFEQGERCGTPGSGEHFCKAW